MGSVIEVLKTAKRVGALTGAGVSTLCGIPDFRGPQGLYRLPNASQIFDLDWFERDPRVYYRGCRELVYGLDQFQPGPVHHALRHLEELGLLVGIATQNIDMLHQKAGSTQVWEVHGSPRIHRCRACGQERSFAEIQAMIAAHGGLAHLGVDYVPRCACGGVYKPAITFFGEALPERAFASAVALATQVDVLLVLGTSLQVYPAASLPRYTLQAGGRVILVNAQPTELDDEAVCCERDLATFAATIQTMT